jgi:hypothetical protein
MVSWEASDPLQHKHAYPSSKRAGVLLPKRRLQPELQKAAGLRPTKNLLNSAALPRREPYVSSYPTYHQV